MQALLTTIQKQTEYIIFYQHTSMRIEEASCKHSSDHASLQLKKVLAGLRGVISPGLRLIWVSSSWMLCNYVKHFTEGNLQEEMKHSAATDWLY